MGIERPTLTPQHLIDEACQRYLDGDQVPVLAKYYAVAESTICNWIANNNAASPPTRGFLGAILYKLSRFAE
jgi:hypothetical protein